MKPQISASLKQLCSDLSAVNSLIIVPRYVGRAATSSALTQVIPSLPRHSQSSSLLMQLPAEVRLRVLRHLLVRSTSIGSRELYDNPYLVHNKGRERDARGRFVRQTRNPTVRGYGFTPSIIGTCQKLFNEALPLLYHHNTLEFHIAEDSSNRHTGLQRRIPHQTGFFDACHCTARAIIDNAKPNLRRPSHFWVWHDGLNKIAHQFKNFLVKVELRPHPKAVAQLRYILKTIAPFLSANKVEVTISQSSNPLPSPKEHFQVLKAFEILRCADFRFINLPDPSAIAVQNTVTSNTPVTDLEEFLPHPDQMLQEALNELGQGPTKKITLYAIRSRLHAAIEDFDENAFLQARFETLRFWQNLTEELNKSLVELRDDKSNDYGNTDEHIPHGRADHLYLMKYRVDRLHVSRSAELGLEIQEDGEDLNSKLRALAIRHNFSPVNNGPTHN